MAVANLAAAGMGNADTYIDMKGSDEANELPLPDWFAEIRFGSWNAPERADLPNPEDAPT